MGKKSDVSLQTLAEFIRDLVYDDFSGNLRWSLSVIHPKTDDGDVGFSGGIWTDYQKAKNQMSISFGFSDTKGIYNFKAWINSSEIRFSFGENPTFEDFKKTAERIFIDEEFCIKTKTPYERTRDKVYATGNRWAKENFDATHNQREGYTVYTRCQKCGKKLTDSESMRRGYGPECWSQISGISSADSVGSVDEAELPGQMTIFDFPDAIPDGGMNG